MIASTPSEVMSGATLNLMPSHDYMSLDESSALTLSANEEQYKQVIQRCAFFTMWQECDNLTGARLVVVPVPQTLFPIDRFTNNNDALLAERLRRQSAIDSIKERWEMYLYDVDASVDVDDISETVDAVLEVVSQFGPSGINFSELRTDDVNGEHLAAMLRTTFTWRHRVTGWHAALGVAERALNKAHVEPTEALFGLL